ncbi:flagellar export chaperone FliS [Domibacillus robiginosus]|uniref:flagellar export chaperone FliS n=1 Tax=Domibacillus robiginosus TaxID=1071054 RepID=UPI00067CC843|nr:flagellar export chaperone FliS [Domibacillus robiginosus]
MNRKKASKAYTHTSITTASPKEIAVLLLQEALKCTKKAKSTWKEAGHFQRNDQLKKAQQCIGEIIPYFNEEVKEGQITAAVYWHVYHLLLQANVQKNMDSLVEAEEIIISLINAWKETQKK